MTIEWLREVQAPHNLESRMFSDGFGPTTPRTHPSRLRTELYSLGLWEIADIQSHHNFEACGVHAATSLTASGTDLRLGAELEGS